eukprot:2910357-Rhodomonas_salina.1
MCCAVGEHPNHLPLEPPFPPRITAVNQHEHQRFRGVVVAVRRVPRFDSQHSQPRSLWQSHVIEHQVRHAVPDHLDHARIIRCIQLQSQHRAIDVAFLSGLDQRQGIRSFVHVREILRHRHGKTVVPLQFRRPGAGNSCQHWTKHGDMSRQEHGRMVPALPRVLLQGGHGVLHGFDHELAPLLADPELQTLPDHPHAPEQLQTPLR